MASEKNGSPQPVAEEATDVSSETNGSMNTPNEGTDADDLQAALASDDLNALKDQLRAMTTDRDELEQKRYVDASLGRFTEIMRLDVDATLESWADNVMMELVPFIGGLQGAFFSMDRDAETPTLRLIGGFALPEDVDQDIALGHGICGQVAKTGQESYYDAPGYFLANTESSLSKIEAKILYVLPLKQNDTVEGVLELTALDDFDPAQVEFLQKLTDALAGNLVMLRNQVDIRHLLQSAQEQKEELQSQEEEMRQNVEELEATQEEMKRVQAEVQESERRLRQLMDGIPSGVVVVTPEGKSFYANSVALSLLGKGMAPDAGEEAPLHSIFKASTEEPYPEAKHPVQLALNGQTEARADDLEVLRSGRRIPLEVTASPILDSQGNVSFAIATYLDITERKEKEQEIRHQNEELAAREEEMRQNMEELEATQEQMRRTQRDLSISNERFQKLGDNLAGMLYQYFLDTTTGEHGFSFVSAGSQALFGKQPDELTGKYADEALLDVHPEDKSAFEAAFAQSAEKQEPFQWRGRIADGQGGWRWIDARAMPRLTDDQNIHWDGYMADVTSEKEREEDLKQAQQDLQQKLQEIEAQKHRQEELKERLQKAMQRFELAADTTTEGLWDLELPADLNLQDDTHFWWSNKFREMLGYQDETDFPNRLDSWANLLHPDHKAPTLEAFNDHLMDRKGETPYDVEYQLKRKDGTYRWYRAVGRSQRDADGNPLRVAGTLIDIQSQKDLAELQRNLEQKVEDQTADLAQREEKLRQSMEELQASEEELRQNMEEMQSTHEELDRTRREMANVQQAIFRSTASIEFDMQGNILSANDNFLNVMGYTQEDIQGQHHRLFVSTEYAESAEYKTFWTRLRAGEYTNGEFERLAKDGSSVWLQASYNPVLDGKGNPYKVIEIAADITGQKQQEELIRQQAEEVQASEEELRQNMEEMQSTHEELDRTRREMANVQQAIFRSTASIEFDMQGNILSANDNFLNVMGYTQEDIQGQHHRLFVSTEYAESPEYKAFWTRLRAGEHVTGEFERLAKDGSHIWLQASYNPVLDGNSRPYKVIKIASDITAQKQQEELIRQQAEEVQASEEELRQNMEEMQATQEEMTRLKSELENTEEAIRRSSAIVNFDMRGFIQDANDNFLQLIGYDLKDLQGKHHRSLVEFTESRSKAYQEFWEGLQAGEPIQGEFRRIAKDGSDVWLNASYNPVLDQDGRPYRVIQFATDITEQKRQAQELEQAYHEMQASEEELRQNMEEMEATNEEMARLKEDLNFQVETLNEAAIVSEADLKGNITFANDKFVEISGYTREELIGKNHSIVNSGYHPKSFWKEMWATIGKGNTFQALICNQAKDGSYYWVDSTFRPVLGENGKPVKYVAVRFDLTKQVEQQEALQQQQAREHASDCIERALANAQLGLWSWNVRTGSFRFSDGWKQSLGYAPEEVEGDFAAFLDLVHEDDQPAVSKVFEAFAAGDQPSFEISYRIRTASGEHRQVRAHGHAEYDEEGQPICATGVQALTAEASE